MENSEYYGLPNKLFDYKYIWTVQDRLFVWAWANKNKETMVQYHSLCKISPVFFCNACVDQMNPRAKVSSTPFFPYLRQKEMLDFIDDSIEMEYDGVYVKARYVGGSWIHMILHEHHWYYHNDYGALIGSRHKDYIDPAGDGDMNALFPKLDYIYSHLPEFMLIDAYCGGTGNPTSPYKVQNMRKNPVTNAQITGEAVTKFFGSGARGKIVFIDELSKCQWGQEGWVASGQTGASRHSVFTPNGKDFAWGLSEPDEYERITGKQALSRPRVFRFDWRDHDLFNEFYVMDIKVECNSKTWKTAEQFDQWLIDNRDRVVSKHRGYAPVDWRIGEKTISCEIPEGKGYNKQYENYRRPIDELPKGGECVIYPWRIREGMKYDDVKAAQELDIDFEGSKDRKVYAIAYRLAEKERNIKRLPDCPLYAFADPGTSTGNAFYVGWAQYNKYVGRYETLRELMIEGRTAYYFRPFLTGRMVDYKYLTEGFAPSEHLELFDEMRDPMWRPDMVYGDPVGMIQTNAVSKFSVKKVWEEARIPVYTNTKWKEFDTRINACRKVLPYITFDLTNTPVLANSISEIQFPEDPDDSRKVVITKGYIHHKIYSHPVSALEQLCCANPNENDFPDSAYIREERFEPPPPQEDTIRKDAGLPDGIDVVSDYFDDYY